VAFKQSAGTSTSPKVFIAEDSINTQVALADLVGEVGKGVVVGTANNEALAIDWVKHNPDGWDIALVDLMLNEGHGFNVVRRFRALSRSGRIIVFSAFVTDVIRRHCHAIGADAVFLKTETPKLVEYLEAM